MKVKYTDYTYFDPNNEPTTERDYSSYVPRTDESDYKQFRFDNSHFNDLITDRRYQDAADYAALFHFNDPRIQKEHENDIINLRREGRKLGAVYSKLNSDELEQIEFIDNVFTDGGLERMKNNKYAKQFAEYKNSLFKEAIGHDSNGDPIYQDNRYLSITLENYGKRTSLGIDALEKDNDATSYNFYKTYNLNEAQLKSAGVNIVNKDGYTSLIFDGTNAMSNELIYDAIKFAYQDTDMGLSNVFINSTNDINKPSDKYILLTSYLSTIANVENQTIGVGEKALGFMNMFNMINNASDIKEKAFEGELLGSKNYSSTVGAALDDNLMELNALLANNEITQQDYNRRVKANNSIVDQAIRSLGSGNYEMFSNAYNEETTDETLVSLDNLQRSEMIQSITAADPKKLHFNAMISNGQIGTLVTIDADDVATKDIMNDENINKVQRRRRQVFIPGLMYEQAQAKLNEDTSTRAAQEINDMQNYGYSFKTSDNQEIYSSNDGKFYMNGTEISKEYAERAINKSLIIQDASYNLKYEFMNNNGEIYDMEGYDDMAKKIAIKAANDLYPNISFEEGSTIESIFSKKGAGAVVSSDYANSMNYALYDKYNEVFDIYDKIMASLNTNL